MSRFHSKKVDSNQPAIVDELRALGYAVYPTHRLGGGFPDILVCGYKHSIGQLVNQLFEIKTARGKLTDDEAKFIASWPLTPKIARSTEDVVLWYTESE